MVRSDNGKEEIREDGEGDNYNTGNIICSTIISNSSSRNSGGGCVDVMVEEGIYDGILIQIFDYLEPSAVVQEVIGQQQQQRTANDGSERTTISKRTQDDIINLTQVSKRFYKIISNYEENNIKKFIIVPVFLVRPSSSPLPSQSPSALYYGSTRRLFNNLRDHSSNEETNDKLQNYQLMRVKDIDKIKCDIRNSVVYTTLRNVELRCIHSLDVSSEVPLSFNSNNDGGSVYSLLVGLLAILPNLTSIDLSNIFERNICWSLCQSASSHLSKVSWNNMIVEIKFRLDGCQLHPTYPRRDPFTVTQIMMDDSIFYSNYGLHKFRDFEENQNNGNNNDNDNNNNIFIFHYCCHYLENVSIRNAKYYDGKDRNESTSTHSDPIIENISQSALLKFVRNTYKTLRWFRSDLSKENVNMLQLEFPNIEFLY